MLTNIITALYLLTIFCGIPYQMTTFRNWNTLIKNGLQFLVN
jgi:hypothetical protein